MAVAIAQQEMAKEGSGGSFDAVTTTTTITTTTTAPTANGSTIPSAIPQTPTSASTRRLLDGRDYYNSLGAPRYILAPMVEHSHLAWRILCRRHAPPPPPHPATSPSANLPDHPVPPFLAYTPMFHSRNFTQSASYILQNLPSAAPKDRYGLDGDADIDRPLVAQFCSNVPDDLLKAVKIVRGHVDAVDLNLGCPQGIAKKGRYGAFLQEEWGLIHEMLSKSATARSSEPEPPSASVSTPVLPPVTAKIRILETPERTLQYAKMILSTGISWLCIHGRTRDQKGHNTGLASWPAIRHLRDNLPPETVIIANGNLLWPGDAKRCLEATGADAVMSAEGALYNPTGIFKDPVTSKPDELFPRMDIVAREYLNILREHVIPYIPMPPLHPTHPEPPLPTAPVLDPNLGPVKSHLFKLLHCLLPRHTDIRSILAKSRCYVKGNRYGWDVLRDFERVVSEVERVTKEELERNPEPVDGNGDWIGPVKRKAVGPDGQETGGWEWLDVPWYRCQPNLRASPEEAVKKGAMARVPGTKGESEAGEKADGKEAKGKNGKNGKRKREDGDGDGENVAVPVI